MQSLLIIDVQNAMFSNPDRPLYNSTTVLENIYKVLTKARSLNTLVIFIQHTTSEGAFAKNSSTWEIHPLIAPLKNETVIQKTRPDSFYQTRLYDTLQEMNVKKLLIAGMQTEMCVDTTCRRASSLGFQNTLISDAHSTFGRNNLTADKIIAHHNEVLSAGSFVQLAMADEITL